MDSLKRRFLSQFGKVSAGAALIPITGINTTVASTAIRNNNQPDRKGEIGKRYAMALKSTVRKKRSVSLLLPPAGFRSGDAMFFTICIPWKAA